MPRSIFSKASAGQTRWLWLAVVVLVLDQLTKYLAETELLRYMPVEVMGGGAVGLSFTLSYNTGAAFSFLADAGGWQRWFFTVLALAVSGFILHWLKRLQAHERMLAVALVLIMGGALGNAFDRLYWGHVIDFLDFYYVADSCFYGFAELRRAGETSCHWPAFNIADSAIFLGAALILIDAFKRKPDTQSDI